jgi:hypothetical protein
MFEPIQDLSWALFELADKAVGRYGHNSFTVDPFNPMLGTSSPSSHARARLGLTYICGPKLLVPI